MLELMQGKNENQLTVIEKIAAASIDFSYKSTKSNISFVFQVMPIVASMAGLAYAFAAIEWAESGRDYNIDALFSNPTARSVADAIATVYCCCSTLYISNLLYLALIRNQQTPSSLTEVLKDYTTQHEKKIEQRITYVGSFLSSIPLAVSLLVFFPNRWPLWTKILIGMGITIPNTVMHFLPLLAALRYPRYSFIFMPAKAMISLYRWMVWTPDEKTRYQLRFEQKAVSEQFMQKIVGDLNLRYHSLMGTIFASKLPDSSELLMRLFEQTPPRNGDVSSQRAIIYFTLFSMMFLAVASTFGYLTINFIVENQLASPWSKIAMAATAVTVYFLTVLVLYMGEYYGNRIGRFIMTKEFPLIAKLYPKSFAIAECINLIVSMWGSSAAMELMSYCMGKFGLNSAAQGFFIVLALVGVTIMSLAITTDMTVLLLRAFVDHFGEVDHQKIVSFDDNMQQFFGLLGRADVEKIGKEAKDGLEANKLIASDESLNSVLEVLSKEIKPTGEPSHWQKISLFRHPVSANSDEVSYMAIEDRDLSIL